MVVGDGEGVVFVVHEGHVRGEARLAVVGGRAIALIAVPEGSQGGHAVDQRPSFQRHRVRGAGVGWGVDHVRLPVAGAARGGHPLRLRLSDKVPPPVDGGHPDEVS